MRPIFFAACSVCFLVLFFLWWCADRVYIATNEVERIHLALQSEQLKSDSLLTALRACRCNGYLYAMHNGGKGCVVSFTHYQTRPVTHKDGRFADSVYHKLAPLVAYEDSLHLPK